MKNIKEQVEEIRELIGEDYYIHHIDGGFVEAVELGVFGEITLDIWNSENEKRDWDEKTKDYTPFKNLILNEIEDAISKLEKLKEQISK